MAGRCQKIRKRLCTEYWELISYFGCEQERHDE